MQPHVSNHFETQAYYQNGPRFNGFIQKNIYPNKIRVYTINLDEHDSIKLIGLPCLLKTMLK